MEEIFKVVWLRKATYQKGVAKPYYDDWFGDSVWKFEVDGYASYFYSLPDLTRRVEQSRVWFLLSVEFIDHVGYIRTEFARNSWVTRYLASQL